MNCPNPPANLNLADEPLWLIVQRDERTQCFEFPADTHKAIVVGSSNNADVRISSAAPVAFFLEREGTTIWLTPAYADPDFRVDTLKVNGRRQIYTHGLVELANVELRLRVRDTPPTLRGDGLVRLNSEISDPISKRAAAALSDLTATTTIDASQIAAALSLNNTKTVSTLLPVPDMALSTKTVEFDAFNFDGWFDDAVGNPSATGADTQPVEPANVTSAPTSNLPVSPTPSAVVTPGRRMSVHDVKTQEMAPIQWPPEPSDEVTKHSTRQALEQPGEGPTPVEPVRPMRASFGPLNVKTQEMAPIKWPPEPAVAVVEPFTPNVVAAAPITNASDSTKAAAPSNQEAPAPKTAEPSSKAPFAVAAIVNVEPVAPNVVGNAEKRPDGRQNPTPRAEPKLDPYRTIEIAPVRLPESKPPNRTSQPKLENLLQTTTIQLGGNARITDTTDFEVPVVKSATAKAEPIVPTATSGGGESIHGIADRRPIVLKTPAATHKASLGSDPWFQGHDSDRPVSNTPPSAVVRTLSSPSKALEKLGTLAQKRPVLVIGGAAIGSLVLVLFFAGAAKVLSPHAKPVPAKAVATQPAAATPDSQKGSPKAPANDSGPVKAETAVGTAQAQAPSETKVEDTPEAIAATPDVTPAVGHLFAGRLPEAEQAYRELAAKFPNEPAFQSASKILARKNSPTCRGASPSKALCPSVKP